jgi:WD40 repeat protein
LLNQVVFGSLGNNKIECFNSKNKSLIKSGTSFHTGQTFFLKYLSLNKNNKNIIINSGNLVASASSDHTVNVWDASTWTSMRIYKNHTNVVNGLDQVDADTMVSGGDDQTIQIWSIGTGETLRTINVGASVYSVRVLFRDGLQQIACGLFGSNINIYNLTTSDLLKSLNGHTNIIYSIEILSENFIASGSADNKVIVWDLTTYSVKYTLKGHMNTVMCVKKISSNLIASTGYESNIIIWDLLTGQYVHNLTGHTNVLWYSALDLFDEQTLISGSTDNTIRLWNISNGQLIQIINTDIPVSSVAMLKITSEIYIFSSIYV